MVFFFFKQKTAYEIYQCDWSSDVCSSDLALGRSKLAAHFNRHRDIDLGANHGDYFAEIILRLDRKSVV